MAYRYNLKLQVRKTSGLFYLNMKGSVLANIIHIDGEIDALINENGFMRIYGSLPISENKSLPIDEVIQVEKGIMKFSTNVHDKTIHFSANLHNLISGRKINDVQIEIIHHGIGCLFFRRLILAGYANQIM